MKPLARRAALIFDLDGVLWNSDEIHAAAYRAVLEPLGVTVPAYSTLAGRRTDEVLRALLSQGGRALDETVIQRLTAAKQAVARSRLEAAPPLTPRCRQILGDLHSRFRLALASSASPGSVETFMRASATKPLFEVVLSGGDVPAAKPAPDIYLAALSRLKLAAADAYVIEDSASGAEAATAAGIDVIAYRNHVLAGHSSGRVIDVIDSLEELLTL